MGCDFLTATVGPAASARLLAGSEFDSDGTARAGFARSEKRRTIGGWCWRRWEPHQESKKWGKSYESWEWASGYACGPALFLRGVDGAEPSRVDIAFDFEVDPALKSDAVLERCRAEVAERGFTTGISGQNDVNTRYVGATTSDRRIRIYRRDLKDPVLAMDFDAMMRVELILKDDAARAWWHVWREDKDRGFAAAAAHIAEMTGFLVMDSDEPVPPPLVEALPESDAAQMVLQFVQQNASMIGAIQAAGVDVFGLAGAVRERWPRATEARHRDRVRRFAGLDGTFIERLVTELLTSRTQASLT